MANIAVIDTGYLNITDSGTQASTLVNSGSSIELKGVSVSFQRKANVDTTEIINTNTGPVAGFGSVTTGRITIRGVLDRNTAADMNFMDDLNQLCETYGVKILYYNDTTDGYRDITDSLGDTYKDDVHKTNNFSGTATPHLHVRFVSFSITQNSNTHLRYVLEAVTTT